MDYKYWKLTEKAVCNMAQVAMVIILIAVQCSGESLMPSIPYPISREMEAEEGTDIQMECSVSNLGEHDVLWIFLDHNATISRNLQILSAETQHYTITRPLGGEYSHFTLNLLNVVSSDAGLYECRVLGTSVKQTVTLTVGGTVTVPPPVVPPQNFTRCCSQAGVTDPCVQACAPSVLDIQQFQPATCTADLPKILTCGTGDRNHYPCCQRRLLPSHCLPFCVGDIPDSLGMEYADCVNKSMDILACFEEGQALLPGPPRSVSALGLTTNIILVSWEPPTQVPSVGVTGYKVFLRKAGSNLPFNSTEIINSNMAQLITDPSKNVYIEPYTLYEIYVIVINQHGASLPSYIVEARSLPTMPERNNATSVSGCCQREGISNRCMPLCENTANIKLSIVLQCTSELGTVYSCLASGRNHTGCCIARDVSPACLSYCGGQRTAPNWSQLQCALQLPQIETCILEGGALIPVPPRNVRLTSITSNSAEIQWDTDTPDTVTYFQIFLKNITAGGNRTEIQVSSTARQALLPPLVPNTLYEVYMIANGQNGSSIPSSEIVFMTYPPSEPTSSTLPTPMPSPQPHNWSECCMKKGVPIFCQSLCSYELRNDVETSMETLATFALCINELPTILACGADQRNHRPCCEEIVLQESCQPLCSLGYNQSFSFNSSHLSCILGSQDIIKCMKQGVDSLPSSPTNFTVYNVTTHTAFLDWDAPDRMSSGHRAQWYIAQYRKVSPVVVAWNRINTTETRRIIHNLEPDTKYEFEVVAYNMNGSSLPSPKVSIWTAQEKLPTTPAPNGTFVKNDTDCCINLNVSLSCRPYCYFTHPDEEVPASCASDILKVFTCRGKEHQNEPCCRRRNVPGMCLGVCRGSDVSSGGLVAELVCPLYFAPIMTCVKEGLESFPSRPQMFRIISQGPGFLEMSWLPPQLNSENARYELYYKRARQDEVTKVIRNITSPYTLTDVEAGKTYEVYLVALNEHGASTPTSVITATTEYRIAAYIVMAEIVTGSVPQEGGSVTLRCEARGTQPIHTYWTYNGKILSKDSIYTNYNISRLQQGEYICHANNGIGEEASETVEVWVLYSPTIEMGTSGRVAVIPNYSVNVYLNCWFGGNITNGYWKHNSVLLSNRRVLTGMNRNVSRGMTEVYLSFRYIVDDDLGRYECIGENSRGNITGIVTLYDPQNIVTTDVVTTVPPATRPISSVEECCRNLSVSERCQAGCAFDVDLDAFLVNSASTRFQCISEAPKLLACAADGRDHEKCCRNAGVPEYCHDACKGIVPSAFSTDPCISYIGSIVECLESGRDLIPSPPMNVRYINMLNDHVTIMWDAPSKLYYKVQKYIVFYKTKSNRISDWKSIRVDAGQLFLDISYSNLTDANEYEMYVVAWNHHGQSQPSARIVVPVPDSYLNTKVPSPPGNLRTSYVGAREVNLVWDFPKTNSKGSLLFHIYYNMGGNKTQYENVTKLTHLELKNLQSGKTYYFWVMAENKYGMSVPSGLLKVLTKVEAGEVASGQSGVSVGIALGVLVPLLLLAMAGLAVLWFIYRRQRNNSRFKESVSFENPGYASRTENIQISGLPGEPTFLEIASQPVTILDGSSEVSGDAGVVLRGNGTAHQPNGEPVYQQLQNRGKTQEEEQYMALHQRKDAQAEENAVQECEHSKVDGACHSVDGGREDKKMGKTKRKAAAVNEDDEKDGGGGSGFKYISLSSLTNGNVVKDKKSHHQNCNNIPDRSSNGHCVSNSSNDNDSRNAAILDITDMQPVDANRLHLHYTDPLESAAV